MAMMVMIEGGDEGALRRWYPAVFFGLLMDLWAFIILPSYCCCCGGVVCV